MARPGSALYHQAYNETYNCLRPAYLHANVPPSMAQKLISLNQGAGKSSLCRMFIPFFSINTSTFPLYYTGKPSKTTDTTLSRRSVHSPTKKNVLWCCRKDLAMLTGVTESIHWWK
jgi:hypothetical protein